MMCPWKARNYRSFPSCLLIFFVSKQVLVRNHSNGNELDVHENEVTSITPFHMKGFAPELILKQRKGNSEMAYYCRYCIFCRCRTHRQHSQLMIVQSREQ